MSPYLSFVEQTIATLIERQSARLGGKPDGALCITVTRPFQRSYLSLGHKEGDRYRTYWFPEKPMEMQPVRMDFEAWPILDLLSEITGESFGRDMVTAMADAFARHGFDPKCGLGYLAEECDFDVVNVQPLPKGAGDSPKFKPRNTGNCPALPLDRLWAHAPQQTARMFRAMFYGLVTDAERMDYNRFCAYNFDDRDRKPSLRQDPAHCAFDTAGSRMIHWWASAYAHTGEAEFLDWAQRMADKWRAVQHPQSGLIPNFFGAIASKPGVPMPPGEWAESRGAALTSVAWLDAVEELKKRSGGERLAVQLTLMAAKLARGVMQFSYDPAERKFREQLNLDGRRFERAARYTFQSQAQKDAAVLLQPDLDGVSIYNGAGFYHNPPYWSHCAGSDIPYQLTQVATRLNDAELLRGVQSIAEAAVEEAGKLKGELTEDDRWTFHATGQYIKMLVLLFERSRDTKFLDWARAIAEKELGFLKQSLPTEWWRFPERSSLLEALLRIEHAAR